MVTIANPDYASMVLNARTLLFFTVLSEERHFGRTAERLGVTQSVLSVGIGRLEDQVGARLLRRGARTAVTLTRAGIIFLPEAQAALAAIQRAERIGQLAARGATGTLKVGYVFSAAIAGPLPRLLARLHEAAPAIDVRLSLMESPEQIEALASGRIDLGLLRPRASYPEAVDAVIVHREGTILALPDGHPLAERRSIDVRDLADETFIVPQFEERVGMIEMLEALARRGGFALRPPRITSDFVGTLSLVAGGCGIALVPKSLMGIAIGGIAHRPLDRATDEMPLALAWRSDLLPSTLAILATSLCEGTAVTA